MTYKWRIPLHNVDPQDVGTYFESLEARDGQVLPGVVVDEARPEDSLLHGCFEWNDARAATLYREQQAKAIIRNISVVVEAEINDGSQPIEVRAFVSTESESRRQYISVGKAMADESKQSLLLLDAMRDAQNFQKKYSSLKQLSGVLMAFDEFLQATAS